MQVEGDGNDADILELSADDIVPQDDPDNPNPEADGEEVIVSIGEEAAPASGEDAPEWVRDLRKRNRELERKLAEAEKAKPNAVPEVGDKPTLEACEYDEERFEREFNAWSDRKSAADRAKQEADKASEAAQTAWQAELGTYAEQRTSLGVKDFDAAEEELTTALSPAQQAIIIQGAESKALVVYALGKNPGKLSELAKITDPVKFAFAVAKLEAQTKMERRRPAALPEGQVRGSAPLSGSTDKTLERLEAEAAKTGDRTKVIAHKKKLKQAGGN